MVPVLLEPLTCHSTDSQNVPNITTFYVSITHSQHVSSTYMALSAIAFDDHAYHGAILNAMYHFVRTLPLACE